MALSGTINGSVTQKSTYFSFYLEWSATQNVAGNYSDVTVKTYWKTNNTYQTFDTVGSRNASITINGTTSSISKVFSVYWSSNPYLIQTATQRVYHNSDGSKSITISARANGHAASYGPSSSTATSGDCTASGTITLNTIPRASSFGTITGNTIGSSMTVNISRNSSSFTHQLWYKLGSSSWYDLGTGIGTSKTFTISSELLNYLPNATSGTLQLCLRTYNGSTQIGSDVYKNITVYVDSSGTTSAGAPTVGAITLTPQTYSYLIQNKNTLKVAVSGCTAGTGSSIKSYTFSGPGLSKITTSTSATSGVISNTGTLTYTVTVTNTRGQTASKTATITCYAWQAPTITLNAYKVASSTSSTVNNSGKYLRCDYNLSFASVNNTNKVSVTIYYKKSTDSTWSSVSALTNGTSTSGYKTISGIDNTATYSVYAVVTDQYGGKTSSVRSAMSGEARVLNISPDGTGVAFGKMSESSKLFESKYKIKAPGIVSPMDYSGSQVSNLVNMTSSNDDADCLEYYKISRGHILHCHGSATNKDDFQIYTGTANAVISTEDGDQIAHSGSIAVRHCKTTGWQPWKVVLDNENFTQFIPDYVIEQKTSGNITYRKWSSGTSEAWYYEQLDSVPLTTLMVENVYSNTSYNGRGVTLPSGLFATGTIPIATANAYSNGYTCCQVASATPTQIVYRIWSPYSATITGCRISIHIIGKWK